MPRKHAQVNMAIWNDEDWLDLPAAAQHLYLLLWIHPGLSYAGVVEWRPARLAAKAAGWTVEDVQQAADCLEARLFIVVDPATEECLVRSFVRFDGMLKKPIMAVSFANARAEVSSRDIRAVIVHEALRLQQRHPDLPGWSKQQVQELLTQSSLDPRDRSLPNDPFTLGPTPAVTPRLTPALGVRPGVGGNPTPNTPSTPTPAPTPSPLLPATPDGESEAGAGKSPRKRGSRVPASFAIDDAMRAWAKEKAPDVDLAKATDEFVDHWTGVAGKAGVKLDWIGTWRNWIRRRQEWAEEKKPKTPTADDRDQWRFR